MKQFISGIAIALVLALVLVMGVVALAENAGNEAAQLPSADEIQPAPEVQEPEAQAPETPEAPAASGTDANDTALQEALKALQEARQSNQQEDLQAELDGYVESGKLTQEQADLIMNWYKERIARKNGTCPNCGYEFQSGKGGRMKGNGFGRGGFGGNNGGFGRGGKGRMGMQGYGNTMPGNGMQAMPDGQAQPQSNAFGGI